MPLADTQKPKLTIEEEELNKQLEALDEKHQVFKQKIDHNISNLNNLNQEDPFKDVVKVTGGGAKSAKGGGCEIM
ncbi:MAG TPA: hypothetical protein LFW21_01370 [Rickettsia endosymbiont of Pyrocoelia pectoralis]|nr:hypothetical protein [Rickettsia endosymbiont of Pyrocoelia pectoralis]